MKKISAVTVLKFAAAAVVGSGTSKIVKGIISAHVPLNTPKDKITVTAATWVLSGIVATAAKKYADDSIDGVVGSIMEYYTEVKTNAALDRINKGESSFEAEELAEADFDKKDGNWVIRKPVEQDA